MLLRQNGDDYEQVQVSQASIDQCTRDEDDTMKVNGYNNGLMQLRPRGSQRSLRTLPQNYHKVLVPGQTYRLLWPGAKIGMWDWGNYQDHDGKELKSQAVRDPKLPTLILPACAGFDFTVKEESEPWPDRAEVESKYGLAAANSEEGEWRREQNPPPSPPPIAASQRV